MSTGAPRWPMVGMKIGGYAKVDFIHDFQPIGSFDYFVTSASPRPGPWVPRQRPHASSSWRTGKQAAIGAPLLA
jgi:hypothetical protein